MCHAYRFVIVTLVAFLAIVNSVVETKAQVPSLVEQQYPSTGFPPWTPGSRVPQSTSKPRPNVNSLLVKAANALVAEGRDKDALSIYEMVLNREGVTADGDALIWNYQHEACKGISEILERRGELDEALRFAILARDKHRYYDLCGLMTMGVRRELDERIASLQGKLRTNSAKLSARSDLERSLDPAVLRR